MVKENLLLLCKTYPDYSQKYYYRICMAGITELGELRRIFPVPITYYIKNKDFFSGYQWIEYDRKEKGDYRKESYKIDFKSVKSIKPSSFKEVNDFIKEKIDSLENLTELRDKENISLGFIKPEISKVYIEKSKNRLEKKRNLSSQLTLFSGTLGDYYIPYFIKFDFSCLKSLNCTGHSIICEDIYFWYFFKEELEKGNSIKSIEKKFEENYLNVMENDEDLIFMMGTHYLFKTWLIVSIISPNLKMSK